MDQEREVESEGEVMEMSGEVGGELEETRVGESRLKVTRGDWSTAVAMERPRASCNEENHESWWALKSPRMTELVDEARSRMGAMSKRYPAAQEEDGGT